MHSMREAIRLNEAQASKPEPHPEAEAIRTALESFDSWAVEVEGYKPGEVSGEALAALDVLVGRLEQAEEGISNAAYALDPNQGEQPDRIRAYQWLRTTFPKDHPNYVDPETLRAREALGVPPQPQKQDSGGGRAARSGDGAA
jgi:hypothetical protein